MSELVGRNLKSSIIFNRVIVLDNYRIQYFEETELVFEFEADDDGAETADRHVNVQQVQDQRLGKFRIFADIADLKRLRLDY